jgi:hypothetical protein
MEQIWIFGTLLGISETENQESGLDLLNLGIELFAARNRRKKKRNNPFTTPLGWNRQLNKRN